MKFNPTLKTKIKQTAQPSPFQFANDVGSVSLLLHELRALRQDIIETTDKELEKIDEKIKEIDKKMEYALQLEKGEKGEDADEQKIADWVLSQIRQPKDGVSPDPEEIVNEVLGRLPKFPNKEQIVAEVLKQLPTPKASLKIIKEELSLDKEALLDEILKSDKLKVKFDGLDMSIKALDRRYIHGGGDTVSAGTNISITRNANGDKVINSLGGGAFSTVTVTPTPDDTTLIYTAASPISAVVINGSTYINGSSAMGGTISIVGTTVTLPNPIGDGGDVYGIA